MKPTTTILWVSADLPFAQERFSDTEGLDNVVPKAVRDILSKFPPK